MNNIPVKVEEGIIDQPQCAHHAVVIEFEALYGLNEKNEWWPRKWIASKWACTKCNKLIPIDFKHLCLND